MHHSIRRIRRQQLLIRHSRRCVRPRGPRNARTGAVLGTLSKHRARCSVTLRRRIHAALAACDAPRTTHDGVRHSTHTHLERRARRHPRPRARADVEIRTTMVDIAVGWTVARRLRRGRLRRRRRRATPRRARHRDGASVDVDADTGTGTDVDDAGCARTSACVISRARAMRTSTPLVLRGRRTTVGARLGPAVVGRAVTTEMAMIGFTAGAKDAVRA